MIHTSGTCLRKVSVILSKVSAETSHLEGSFLFWLFPWFPEFFSYPVPKCSFPAEKSSHNCSCIILVFTCFTAFNLDMITTSWGSTVHFRFRFFFLWRFLELLGDFLQTASGINGGGKFELFWSAPDELTKDIDVAPWLASGVLFCRGAGSSPVKKNETVRNLSIVIPH